MLKKIVSIKNVGRFYNSATAANPQLTKYTFIAGANGYGKSTLCAVLRALRNGDPAGVLGRSTLGRSEIPSIELLWSGTPVRFNGVSWTATKREIAIFDSVFVAENVHSGEVVDIEHKRNLYRVIIGEEGVKLAAEDAALSSANRLKTIDISSIRKSIQEDMPTGISLNDFIDLPEMPDIAQQIEAQENNVDALRQAEVVCVRPALSEFAIPALPDDFTLLLARTLDDISRDAEEKLSAHLVAHEMPSGGNWLATGLGHVTDTCPFCGQDVQGLPLVAAFRAVFSERYTALHKEIVAMKERIARDMGDAVLARLDIVDEQNKNSVEFWQRYCAINSTGLALPSGAAEAIRAIATAAIKLLDRKTASPLELIEPDAGFNAALAPYEAAASAIRTANDEVRSVNTAIAAKKAATDARNLKAVEVELARLKAIQARHSPMMSKFINIYRQTLVEKEAIDERKEVIRKELATLTATVLAPYERRINDYLDCFNAGFAITKTRHAYPGGVATSSYQIVINETAVELGDNKTPENRPSFKNTLSAGDRTTLALAFFLAHLEQDPAIASRVVVFDDPFNSQDAFRRRQTVHEIMKVAAKCAQVIVLSHDPTFLKQVWDKSPTSERVALQIANHRAEGSKLTEMDLEQALKGRTIADIDDLQEYKTSGKGQERDVIRKIRVVLETHCRITFPGSFQDNDWLGVMVQKIRDGGESHPARGLYDELDQINDYTKRYHHGENMLDATPDQIDATELHGFTRRTLRIVNALVG